MVQSNHFSEEKEFTGYQKLKIQGTYLEFRNTASIKYHEESRALPWICLLCIFFFSTVLAPFSRHGLFQVARKLLTLVVNKVIPKASALNSQVDSKANDLVGLTTCPNWLRNVLVLAQKALHLRNPLDPEYSMPRTVPVLKLKAQCQTWTAGHLARWVHVNIALHKWGWGVY